MGKDDWQDAWVMDFARGSMMSQLWGDISLLDRDDLEFLARMCTWTRENAHLLRNTKRILGSPWKAGPYGYACFDGDEGAMFIHNAQFNSQEVYLRLGPEFGFTFREGDMSYVVRCLHPGHKIGDMPDRRPLYAGDQIQIDLEPFEVRMVHILPAAAGNESQSSSLKRRQMRSLSIPCRFEMVLCETVHWEDPSMRAQLCAVLNGRVYAGQDDQLFHRAQSRTDERDRDITRRVNQAQAILPPVGSSTSLLVVVRLLRDGICWHHTGPFEIVRLSAILEGQRLPCRHTPDRWHEQAGAWSWIVFELSLTPCERAGEARFELKAFLPRSVETEVETWIFIKEGVIHVLTGRRR
ncbi:MAG: hypothetical protein HY709_00390 [Candidatus Latescibacteria bacterium]|nr:hypothetical protein [Candidatus Latescibacterota bacterium]